MDVEEWNVEESGIIYTGDCRNRNKGQDMMSIQPHLKKSKIVRRTEEEKNGGEEWWCLYTRLEKRAGNKFPPASV